MNWLRWNCLFKKLPCFAGTLAFLFCCVILVSCTDKAGKNYYYLPMDEAMDIGFPLGSIVYKSTQKNVMQDVLIYSDIEQYETDSRYILVQQRPNRELMENNVKQELTFWSTHYVENKKDTIIDLFGDKMSINHINNLLTKHSGNNLQRVADSILNNNSSLRNIFKNKQNYYLIDKKTDSLYGPMTKSELSKIKGQKGIALTFD